MSAVVVVATVEADNTPPRVRLNVTDTGSPSLFDATVTRLNPDGRTVPVRTSDGNPLQLTASGSNRVGLLYDYEMPYGAPVSYSTTESPDAVSAEVTVDEQKVWLIHPGVPALSVPITASGITGRTRRVQRGVHYPMGRKHPVVQTDGQRKGAEYTLTIRTTTADDRAAVDALLDDTNILLLNVPAGRDWGITAEYVSVGDSDEGRLLQYAREQRRHWQLPLIVVDIPIGGSQAERTLADLLDYPTLASLMGAYDTFADLLAGP